MNLQIPTTTRRLFLGGAAAGALWPKNLLGAGMRDKLPKRRAGSVWERSNGYATDSILARRLYLDLAGRIPTMAEAQDYAFSTEPDKRERLVGRLLASPEFTDYWTMRFCDILRVKSEFPINLWPNAVYVYHARIRAFVEQDEPWDAFGRALLTAQGSDFRDGAANFFRATDRRNPEGWAEATAQTFLGIPPEKLDAHTRKQLAGYFTNVRIKDTREWKEEIVFVDGADRRGALCDALFVRRRDAVAAAFRSLVRTWIFGPDAGAGASAVKSMRLRDVLREIVLSKEYALGSVTGGFPARRLDAEILDDVVCAFGGDRRNLQSPAPEPFTFLPPERSTVCVEDGSITTSFLSLFGRPARDTGLPDERGSDVNAKQRLYLFNSGRLHLQLAHLVDSTPPPANAARPLVGRVNALYWKILSRAPSVRERQAIIDLARARAGKGARGRKQNFQTLLDVAWCLVNTKEFLFRV